MIDNGFKVEMNYGDRRDPGLGVKGEDLMIRRKSCSNRLEGITHLPSQEGNRLDWSQPKQSPVLQLHAAGWVK